MADCPLKQGMGLTQVSMEQVLQWNPDVIITEQRQIYDAIREESALGGHRSGPDKQNLR